MESKKVTSWFNWYSLSLSPIYLPLLINEHDVNFDYSMIKGRVEIVCSRCLQQRRPRLDALSSSISSSSRMGMPWSKLASGPRRSQRALDRQAKCVRSLILIDRADLFLSVVSFHEHSQVKPPQCLVVVKAKYQFWADCW